MDVYSHSLEYPITTDFVQLRIKCLFTTGDSGRKNLLLSLQQCPIYDIMRIILTECDEINARVAMKYKGRGKFPDDVRNQAVEKISE